MIFKDVNEIESRLPVDSIHQLRTNFEENKWTGLMRLHRSHQSLVYLFFSDGQPVFACTQENRQNEVLDPKKLDGAILDQTDYSTRVASLSSSALRMCKLAICHTGIGEAQTILTTQLPALMQKWSLERKPCLVHTRWDHAEGLALFDGERWVKTSILFTPEDVKEGTSPLDLLSSWKETQCLVTRKSILPQSDAWKVYNLWLAFTSICKTCFSRYEEFTGGTMVQSTIWTMAELGNTEGMAIKVLPMQLESLTFFPDAEPAARLYGMLLEKLNSRIRSILGPGLLNSILRDAWNGLSPYQRELVQEYHLPLQGFPSTRSPERSQP